MLGLLLIFFCLQASADAAEIDRQLRALAAEAEAERGRAQRWLAEHLGAESVEVLREAVRGGGPEVRHRLREIFSVRPDFFPVLLDWLGGAEPERALARAVMKDLYRSFRSPSGEYPEEPASPDPLDFLQRHWVRLPSEPYPFLRLVDCLNRFRTATKPLLLDARLAPFWEGWRLEGKGVEDFAGPLLQRILAGAAGPVAERLEIVSLPSFLWIGRTPALQAEGEIFLDLLESLRSGAPEVRRIAARNLGLLGYGPLEKHFVSLLVGRKPGWEEAALGLCTGPGVSPWLQDRGAVEALVRSLAILTGVRREITYTLLALGPRDALGRPLDRGPLPAPPQAPPSPDPNRVWPEVAGELAPEGLARAAEAILRASRRGEGADLAAGFEQRFRAERGPKSKARLAAVAAAGGIPFPDALLEEAREILFSEMLDAGSSIGDLAAEGLGRAADAGMRERLTGFALDDSRNAALRRRALRALGFSLSAIPGRARLLEVARARTRLASLREKGAPEAEILDSWDGDWMRRPLTGENLLERDWVR